MQRRRGDSTSGGSAGTSAGSAAALGLVEERELAVLGDASSAVLAPAPPRSGRPGGATRAPSRSSSTGSPLAPSSSSFASRRPSTQPIGVVSSAVRSGIDRARDDQPVDRPRHRDVVEAQPLGLAPRPCALPGPPRRRTRRARLLVIGSATLKPKRPSESARISCARRRRPVAACVGDDDDLELEALGGVDRQQPHRVGALLLRDRLELARADGLLLATKRTKPSTSGPRSSSYERASRASLRRFA